MEVFFLCRTSSRPSGSVPSAPSTSLFAETSLGVSLPGSSSSSSSLPLGGQGKRGGGLGVHLVFFCEVLPPLPLDLGLARGARVPLGICLSRAGSLLLLLLLREVGARELALLLQTPFSRFSWSVDSPQFSPHVPRRENSGESSVSCSRVLSSRESCSSERGSGMDKRAWSREVSSRGRRCRSRSLSAYRSRLSGRERGGGGHRPRHAFLVVAHAVGGRGLLTATALSVEALGRVVPGLDPRIDIGHAVTALGVGSRGLLTATAPAVSVRVPMPVGGCGAVVRDRTLSRIARVTARGQACDYLLLLPACGPWKQDGWPDVGPRRVWRRLSLSLLWPGAAAGVHPVLEGRPLPLSRLFLQELAKFFMGLSGSSSLGAPGVLAGVTASGAASGGVACPSSPAAGAATFCAATVTPAGAGVLPAAPAAGPGVSGDQQRQGMSRSRGRCSRSSGDGTDGRA